MDIPAQPIVSADVPPNVPVSINDDSQVITPDSLDSVALEVQNTVDAVSDESAQVEIPQEQAVEPQGDAPQPIPSPEPLSPSPTTGTMAQNVPDVLVQDGVISQDLLSDVQAEAVTTGRDVETLLLEHGYVNEDQMAKAKAKYFNIPFVSLTEIGAAPEALNQVPEGVARRYFLLPFAIDKAKHTLSVAMVNPLDLRAIDFVEKKTGYQLVPHLSTKSDLEVAINERYAQSLSTEVTAALKETSQPDRKVIDVRQLGEVIREAPIAKIVETVLTFAMKARASDVHIEPQEEKTRIRYRIDGILHEKLVLPKGVQDAVVSRIKILAGLKIDEKRLPQDGRFSFRAGEDEVDLRVSTLPTVHGEKVVMRLLKKAIKVPTFQELGLRGMALKYLEASIIVPHGIILITGPTGSGKTTSLYSILNKINTPRVNIVTLEDPVEYEIPGVNQVQINNQAGLTFASGLRSFLRQDPNIIMVGEVRDKETAELAIQASLTGHLVFSTLHTNSASGALPRLLDMEAEPYLLASSMTCVVAQRVVRQICDHCKTKIQIEPALVQDIKRVLGPLFTAWLTQHKITEQQVELFKGSGCSECSDTGYTGRVGIFEVLPITEKIGRLILERASDGDIEKQAVSDGMILMKQDGYLKALEGVTTVEEVLRVAEVARRDVLEEEVS